MLILGGSLTVTMLCEAIIGFCKYKSLYVVLRGDNIIARLYYLKLP